MFTMISKVFTIQGRQASISLKLWASQWAVLHYCHEVGMLTVQVGPLCVEVEDRLTGM